MEQLTKRQFLKRALLAGGALAASPIMAACAPAPAAAPAAKPAEAPKASAPAAKPAAAKEQITLRFHMRSGGEKSEPAIYVERPGEWEQETGHKVKLEPIPSGKDYIPKVEALAASNTIGDIVFTQTFQFEHNHLMQYNVLAPYDDWMASAGIKKSEWFAPVVEAISLGGKMYGTPKTGHPLAPYLWINLKMFDEAGIKKPEVFGTTHEQVAEWANKLSKGPKDKRDVYGLSIYLGIKGIGTSIRTFGGDLSNKEGTASQADSPEWFEWTKWHAKLIAEDRVHPMSDVVGTNSVESLFVAEKVAMLHYERSGQRNVRIGVKDKFPWMAIQFPKGPKFKGWQTSVNSHAATTVSKHKEEAFSLTYALADKRFAYLVAKEQGFLCGRVDNLEAIKEFADDPFLQLQQKCTEEMSAAWFMKNFRGYEYETALTNQLDLLWLGNRKVDSAFMSELRKTLDDTMTKPI